MFRRHNFPIIFIAVSALLFLIYYLVIILNVQPSGDDFHFMSIVKTGLPNAFAYNVEHWNGRISAAAAYLLFFKLSHGFAHFRLLCFFQYTFTISVLIYSFYQLVAMGTKAFSAARLSVGLQISYAILATAILFWTMINVTETWLWANASFEYISSVALALLGLVAILQTKKNYSDFLIAFFCFSYVGGANEITAIFFLIVLVSIVFYKSKVNDFKFLFTFTKDRMVRKTALAFSGLMTLLILNFFTAATQSRIDLIRPKTPPSEHLRLTYFFENDTVVSELVNKRTLVALLLSTAFCYAGIKLKEDPATDSKEIAKKIRTCILITGSATILAVLIAVLIMGNQSHWTDVGTKRGWVTYALPLVGFIACVSIYIGYIANRKILVSTLIASQVIFCGITAYLAYDYSTRLTLFSKAYTERIEYLTNLKQQNYSGTITLKPLPASLLLCEGRLSEDPEASLNKAFADALDLPFKVKEQ